MVLIMKERRYSTLYTVYDCDSIQFNMSGEGINRRWWQAWVRLFLCVCLCVCAQCIKHISLTPI